MWSVLSNVIICFKFIPDARQSVCRPPLGRSDYSVIHLVPKYQQKLKQEQARSKCVRIWDKNSSEALKGCFERTDWQVFFDGCDSSDHLTDTYTFYIQFCEDTVIESRCVRIFHNNKPWINKELKQVLTGKKDSLSKHRCVKSKGISTRNLEEKKGIVSKVRIQT